MRSPDLHHGLINDLSASQRLSTKEVFIAKSRYVNAVAAVEIEHLEMSTGLYCLSTEKNLHARLSKWFNVDWA